MPSVLVVDDAASSMHILRASLEGMDIEVLAAECAAEALDLIARRRPDVAILDLVLPDQSGLESFEAIRRLDPQLPVIFVTALGTSATAIEAMKKGAFDYLVKPLDVSRLRLLVEQALRIRRFMHVTVRTSELEERDSTGTELLIGRCEAMQEVYKAIGRVAQHDIPVLIRGESGTGKELVARAIYQHSPRSQGPFLAVNCAAIPETLLESELFGHEKGAFTGANGRKIGKFERCNGGTLFLDEVGDMTPMMQSKVLRVSRTSGLSAWAAARPSKATCGLWPPRTVIWKRWSLADSSAPISIIASTDIRSHCLRCASGAATFRSWWSTF